MDEKIAAEETWDEIPFDELEDKVDSGEYKHVMIRPEYRGWYSDLVERIESGEYGYMDVVREAGDIFDLNPDRLHAFFDKLYGSMTANKIIGDREEWMNVRDVYRELLNFYGYDDTERWKFGPVFRKKKTDSPEFKETENPIIDKEKYVEPKNEEEMNLIELAEKYPEISVTIRLGDLIEANEMLIKRAKEELEQLITDQNTETYPTREKVMEILDVSAPTLWRWAKSGYLKPLNCGGKRRYRMSDVRRILEGGKPEN